MRDYKWEKAREIVFDIEHLYNIFERRSLFEAREGERGRFWGHLPPTEVIKIFFEVVNNICAPKKILEIGTCLGYSSTYMLQTFPESIVDSIDIRRQTCHGIEGIGYVEKRYPDRFRFTQGDSKELDKYYKPDVFDFAFIDGDHSYSMAVNDIRKCKSLNIPIIALDNVYGTPSVKKAAKDEGLRLIFEQFYTAVHHFNDGVATPETAVYFEDSIAVYG